ncbi:hypothetical protein [Lysobacter olei]
MSKVVQFLEVLGAGPGGLTDSQYLAAVDAANLDNNSRSALVRRDRESLNELLGGRAQVIAYVFTPEEEPDGDAPMRDVPDDDDGGAPEDEPKVSIAA